MLHDGVGDDGDQYLHVFVFVHGSVEVKFLISPVMNFVLGVERMLLSMIFTVVRSAILVLTLPS